MIHEQPSVNQLQRLFICVSCTLVLFIGFMGGVLFMTYKNSHEAPELSVNNSRTPLSAEKILWHPPDSMNIPDTPEGSLIRYGRELVAHTAVYLGPRGKVASISNGMNCQNCHLKAGKKIFGNNYAAVASTYPKYRPRSGTTESIERRVNDCIERSLNGIPLNEGSRELTALVSYIKWVGHQVPKKTSPYGTGLIKLKFLDRAADPTRGRFVYQKQCALCHGADAEGVKNENGIEWKYPPLAGNDSYNTGAGLFRVSRFAAYVKANMPNGTSFENPVLTDEEAWDVGAYINSLPRPSKRFERDWPDISKKPVDHPFGPYVDTFSEEQHKYGPFTKMKTQ
jgi:thiosulfate dehydrogenase